MAKVVAKAAVAKKAPAAKASVAKAPAAKVPAVKEAAVKESAVLLADKGLSINEVRKRAKEMGLTVEKTAKKLEIIRSIQSAEGYTACFGTPYVDCCGQQGCCWRGDCKPS